MTDLKQLERLRVETMEQAIIDGIPKELLRWLDESDARFAAAGGCKGCGSKLVAVHYGSCPTLTARLGAE